jgi:ParB family chromosome partitioning protein
MRKTDGSLALAGFDDIFGGVMPQVGEVVTEIPLAELFPPDCHPFQVNNDAAMGRLVESIREFGVRDPGLARKRSDGGYELLCGNRRKMACELIGLPTLPVIVRDLDDDSATIAMVDSNLQQREKILPSEKAWAYRMKMEALNHNGVKGDRNSCDVLAEQTGECKTQIFKIIRLTELVEVLLDKVDRRELAVMPAVELSYLSFEEQTAVVDCMDKYAVKPSLSQAVRFKRMKQAGTLTAAVIDAVLSEEKKPPHTAPTAGTHYRKFFPPDYSPKQIEAVIVGLLKDWKAAQSGEVTV